MERTQIYLPKTQLTRLRQEAHRRETTVSSVIRLFIDDSLLENRRGHKKRSIGLLASATRINKLGHKGPKDLARNMDSYLYGGI